MKVFVTGHAGYVGVHLVDILKQYGHSVTGCDLYLFDGCELTSFTRPDKEIIKDIRELTIEDIQGHDCIMHLAAVSNDPMGELDPSLTYSINREGSIRLAKLAKECGIERFLFSGSCSVYAKGDAMVLDETAPLNPMSAYACSKIETEQALRVMADDDFSPIVLRNATAYGYSPMLRIDLVVNNLLACAATRGDIRIMSDGKPWRPFIHVRDIARAFVALMHAPRILVHNKAINIGSNNENYQVKDIATKVQELIPSTDIVFTGEAGHDPRDYRVNFNFLNALLPDFRLEYTLSSGMDELHSKFKEHNFTLSDFEGDKFIRLKTLSKRLNKLALNEEVLV